MRCTLATFALAALALLPSSTALPLSARQLTPSSTAPLAIAFQDRHSSNLYLSHSLYECAAYSLSISTSSFPLEVVAVEARSDGRPMAHRDGEQDKVLAVVAKRWIRDAALGPANDSRRRGENGCVEGDGFGREDRLHSSGQGD
ncbi:hypothetical protein JCM10213_007691 [Rhodosporidiobolus nylandii]